MRPAQEAEEEDRTPVGRPDFKSGETRTTCLVGSTPTLFRQCRGRTMRRRRTERSEEE